MRVANIAPTPLLNFYGTTGYHLILTHILAEDIQYRRFYEWASQQGDFIILDNSAHELGVGETYDLIAKMAETIMPSEIVLPDRLFFADDTVNLSSAAYPKLRAMFPSVRLMGVPQGRAPKEFDMCCEKLLDLGVDTIGLSKDYEVWKGGLVARVEKIRELCSRMFRNVDIHLLGWGRDLGELVALADMTQNEYAPIRGIDSAKPLVYADAGIILNYDDIVAESKYPEYPGRRRDFFSRTHIDKDFAYHNLSVFHALAGRDK